LKDPLHNIFCKPIECAIPTLLIYKKWRLCSSSCPLYVSITFCSTGH